MTRGSEAQEEKTFQVSGLGRREPGSGVQVLVQDQDLNFTPYPHLYLITRTRDLRAETWDPKLPRSGQRGLWATGPLVSGDFHHILRE